MFTSIRWRLVASYVMLTVLTVGILGTLTLSLVRRFSQQRELDFLTANARAVAEQAAPFVAPAPATWERAAPPHAARPPEANDAAGTDTAGGRAADGAAIVAVPAVAVPAPALEHLARSTAFLIDARVRVLTSDEHVLADSGPRTGSPDVLWITERTDEIRMVGRAPGGDPASAAAPGLAVPGVGGKLRVVRLSAPDAHAGISRTLMIAGYLPPADASAAGAAPGALAVVTDRVAVPGAAAFGLALPRVAPEPVPAPGAAFSATLRVGAASPHMTVIAAGETGGDPSGDASAGRVVRVPIGGPGGTRGFVEVSQGPDLESDAVAFTRHAINLAAAAASLLAGLLGLVVSRSLTAPLRDLAGAAARAHAGDLSVRAPVQGHDEIARVAEQFNAMAERLEASFVALAEERDALRRFVADASHELRTPITALRNFNDLLQSPAVDEAARREFIAESGAQIERLTWVTRNLLDLSRFDAGLVELDVVDCDAGDVLASVASAFQPTAAARGIDLAVADGAAGVVWRCDRARVALAVSNLVDNALKFTPAGGRVVLGADAVAGAAPPEVRVWVRDSGPGIGAADAPHVVERFYRGSAAPAHDAAAGSGLGLAIVKSVMDAHAGRVEVDGAAPGGGCTVTLCFGAAARPSA